MQREPSLTKDGSVNIKYILNMEPDEKREDNRHGCINNNKKFGLEQAFRYLHKDPEKILLKSWIGQINLPETNLYHSAG